jgi:hypothetical protein
LQRGSGASGELMTNDEAERITQIEARLKAATPGPWEYGDRQYIAGVMPDRYGEDRCVFCARTGEPTWTGRRNINGKQMLAHIHTGLIPDYQTGIVAFRVDGSCSVVIETDEYGLMDSKDADFIAHAREDIPYLLEALKATGAREFATAESLEHYRLWLRGEMDRVNNYAPPYVQPAGEPFARADDGAPISYDEVENT